MKTKTRSIPLTARRAELMAELFFEGLDPAFVARPADPAIGYDLLVGFTNGKGGINSFSVKVKAIDYPPGDGIEVARDVRDRFAYSNVPAILLVADVKQNHLYYGWFTETPSTRSRNVRVPLTALDDAATKRLKKQLTAGDVAIAAAG